MQESAVNADPIAADHGEEARKGSRDIELSIVVPVHNSSPYLENCIEMLLDQGFDDGSGKASCAGNGRVSAEEIIFVDDASTDGSAAIIERAMEGHPEIRLIRRKDNGGAGVARNEGMRAARGEYLYFFDSDDAIERGCLRRMCDRMRTDRLDALLFSGDIVREGEGNEANKVADDYLLRRQEPGVRTGRELFIRQVKEGCFCVQPCVVICRTGFVRGHGDIRFSEGIINEDNEYLLTLLIHAQRCDIDQQVYYHYYVRGGTVTSTLDQGFAHYDSHSHISDLARYYAYLAREQGDSELEWALCGMDYYFTDTALSALYETPVDQMQSRELTYPTYTALVNERSFYRPLCACRHEIDGLNERVGKLESERDGLQRRLDETLDSTAWKVGRALTWLPRKAKSFYLARRGKR